MYPSKSSYFICDDVNPVQGSRATECRGCLTERQSLWGYIKITFKGRLEQLKFVVI